MQKGARTTRCEHWKFAGGDVWAHEQCLLRWHGNNRRCCPPLHLETSCRFEHADLGWKYHRTKPILPPELQKFCPAQKLPKLTKIVTILDLGPQEFCKLWVVHLLLTLFGKSQWRWYMFVRVFMASDAGIYVESIPNGITVLPKWSNWKKTSVLGCALLTFNCLRAFLFTVVVAYLGVEGISPKRK